LHPSGKEVIQVFNVTDLDEVDPYEQIVQIGGSVGSRKRIDIINEADELGIHIINPQIRRLEDFDEEEFVELEDEFIELEDDEFDDLALVEDEDLEDEFDEVFDEDEEEEDD
jgi:large subunit ribosomal protein L32e